MNMKIESHIFFRTITLAFHMAEANQNFLEMIMFENFRKPFLILILYLAHFQKLHANESCNINSESDLYRKNSPIFLSFNETESTPNYIYPTVKDPDHISIPAGQILTVFCPGKTNRNSTEIDKPGSLLMFNKILKPRRSIENVECVKNNEFKIHNCHDENHIVSLKNISCQFISQNYAYNAIMKKTNKKCGIGQNQGDCYEIGYDLGNYGFLKTLDLCHEAKRSETFWVHSVLVPVNQEEFREHSKKEKKKAKIGRFTFQVGSLFKGMSLSSSANGPYTKKNQFETILNLLQDKNKTNEYISLSKDSRQHLAQGHLIARADKFYRSEQDSTYFFANVVPMWQTINAIPGNWFFVEEYLRHLAFHKNTKLDVWAGGIGIFDLQETSNQNTSCGPSSEPVLEKSKLLILSNKVPVPKVLFKCAVDKTQAEGLCFLVVNNPYLSKGQVEEPGNKYIVCKKYVLCEKVRSDYDTMESGYFYCCKLRDFIDKFEEELSLQDLEKFKDFKVMSLLTYEKDPKIVKVLRSCINDV